VNHADRERLHARIERAIDRLKSGGMRIGPKMHDALYRMACVGAMAVSKGKNPELMHAIVTGRKLSNKTWQEVLGGND